MAFLIEIYEKENGEIPFIEFLEVLSSKMKAKVLRDLDVLQNQGNMLREPISAPLTDGLFELRTKQGSDITRTIYFFVVGGKIIITHGFLKKTKKTPQTEILKAENYRKDWIRRNIDEVRRSEKQISK